jgi:alkaline phosphatase
MQTSVPMLSTALLDEEGPVAEALDEYARRDGQIQMAGAVGEVMEDGGILMVEAGTIDWAGHDNQLARAVFETLEFARAFEVVRRWAESRTDTLVVVTADHECGGLAVGEAKGKGEFPDAVWTTGGHTGANVPVYAFGPGADRLKGVIDNTDLAGVLAPQPRAAVTPLAPTASAPPVPSPPAPP